MISDNKLHNSIYVIKKHQNNLSIDRLITISFVIAILLGVCANFIAVLPRSINRFLFVSSTVFGYVGVFLFIMRTLKRPVANKVFYWWIALVLYMTILGIILSRGAWKSSNSLSCFISQDLRYVMYTAIGFALANKAFIKEYHKIMKFLGVLSIFFGILALANYPFDINRVIMGFRIGIWDMPYHYWWLSASIFAYNFSYSRITGKDKIIGYGSFAVYAVLGLLFLKGVSFINCLALLVITTFIKPNKNKSISRLFIILTKIIMVAMVLVIVFLIFGERLGDSYVGALFGSLFNRINVVEFSSYDRAREATLYFNSVLPIYNLTGQGLGNYVTANRFLNALHIGLYNIIYKGGILYLFFWIYLIVNFIKKISFRKKLSQYNLVCLSVALSATLSLLYEFSFTYTIVIIGYATPIAYLIQHRKGENEVI